MEKKRNWNLLIYVYIADICLLPTWHAAGLPFKFAYLFGFMWLSFFVAGIKVNMGYGISLGAEGAYELKHSEQGRKMLYCVLGIMLVAALGELTAAAYVQLVDMSSFRNAMFFYVVLICSLGIGYTQYDFNKDYLLHNQYCIVCIRKFGTIIPVELL